MKKMMKQLLRVAGMLALLASLAACSSPEEKAAGYIASGNELYQEGDFKKAEIEFKNALQINQNLPDAWYGLARIHEQKRQWKRTYAVLNKLRELAPGHVEGRLMLGQLMLASNQLDQALTDAGEVIELAPDNAGAHALMAAVQFRLENFEGAHEEVDKALALDPANSDALLVRARVFITQERYDEALALLDNSIERDRENVSFYLMQIQVHEKLKNPQAIEEVFLALIGQFPDTPGFKQALARHYLAAQNIDAAEKMLKQIVDSDAADVDARVRFVGFKRQHRSLEEAIALVKSYADDDRDEYRYRFLLGELHEKSGSVDEALEVFENIVTDDGEQPNGLEARNRIAILELRNGNREKTSALINEVLSIDKNNESALLLQSGLQIADGRIDDAIVNARTVLRDNPASVKALALLGNAYFATGSQELAIESFSKAFQLNPGASGVTNQLASNLIRQRNFSQADDVLQKSLGAGNRSVDTLKLFVQVKLALREWDQAEKLARLLQEVEGQEAVSQQLLGAVYQGKGQQEASIEAFKRAHELAPGSAQPVVSVVRAYMGSGLNDEAWKFLNSILAVDDDNATAILLMGELSLAEGNQADAIRYFRTLIEKHPEMEVGYRNLTRVYMQQNDITSAEAVTRQALEAIPERPILSMNLATINEARGDFDQAIEIYRDLLGKDENLLVAKNNLASLLTDHGGDEASLEEARTISAELKDSRVPQFRDTYAWAQVVSGANLEEAIVILEGIVRENEEVDIYRYHLGEAYRRKGDTENAIASLNQVLETADPESDTAKMARQSLQQIQ
jgi:tetratricopeptide (TPR) repeat protein